MKKVLMLISMVFVAAPAFAGEIRKGIDFSAIKCSAALAKSAPAKAVASSKSESTVKSGDVGVAR